MAKKHSFDQSYKRLQEIVELLEGDEVSIDQLSDLVNEAVELVKICKNKLRSVEEDIDKSLA